jgi:hypothetical protein
LDALEIPVLDSGKEADREDPDPDKEEVHRPRFPREVLQERWDEWGSPVPVRDKDLPTLRIR